MTVKKNTFPPQPATKRLEIEDCDGDQIHMNTCREGLYLGVQKKNVSERWGAYLTESDAKVLAAALSIWVGLKEEAARLSEVFKTPAETRR